MHELTPDEARYTAPLVRAELRRVEAEAAKYSVGHLSGVAFRRAVEVYQQIAGKLERRAAQH